MIVVVDELSAWDAVVELTERPIDISEADLMLAVAHKEDPPEFPRDYREPRTKDWEQRQYKRPKRRRR